MKRIIFLFVCMFVKVLRNYMYFIMYGMLFFDYFVDNEEEFYFGNMWLVKGWKENVFDLFYFIKKCCVS